MVSITASQLARYCGTIHAMMPASDYGLIVNLFDGDKFDHIPVCSQTRMM